MGFSEKKYVEGDIPTIRFQVTKNKIPQDISGMTFKLGVKAKFNDAEYLIGPIDGTVDPLTNTDGSFTFEDVDGNSLLTPPCKGMYEVAMYDGSTPPKRTTLTPPKGVKFEVIENIIDE